MIQSTQNLLVRVELRRHFEQRSRIARRAATGRACGMVRWRGLAVHRAFAVLHDLESLLEQPHSTARAAHSMRTRVSCRLLYRLCSIRLCQRIEGSQRRRTGRRNVAPGLLTECATASATVVSYCDGFTVIMCSPTPCRGRGGPHASPATASALGTPLWSTSGTLMMPHLLSPALVHHASVIISR